MITTSTGNMKDLHPTSTSSAIPPPVPPKTTGLSIMPFPDQVQCFQCKQFKSPKDTWWCRSCHKALCSSCNLMQGHTEHRTAPWRPDELVRSLADAIDARCNARTHRASEEESAIREYMREVENYFLTKLRRQLEEKNQEDHALIQAVLSNTGISTTERKRWPPASHSPTPLSNSTTSLHPTLVGFDLLTDESVVRLVNDIDRLLPADGVRKTTVSKFPRLSSGRSSAPSSPLLGNDRRSIVLTKFGSNAADADPDGRRTSISSTSRFYNFAAVLPDIEPLEFAQLLEQQRDFTPRTRSRSQSGQLQLRSTTPFLEHVSSRAQSPAPNANGTALSVYGSLDVDATDHNTQPPAEMEKHASITPITKQMVHQVQIESRKWTQDYEESSYETAASSVQLMISEDTQTSGTSWLTSATQTDALDNGLPIVTSTPNGSPEETHSDRTLPVGESSMDSSKSNNGDSINGGSIKNITAFHFGDEYLTRPIDVRPLPNGKLAVSDSCGGVYVTNSKGDVLHQISLDGFSASSLCYLPTLRPDREDDYPPLLLISVLRKRNRSLYFYDARDFTLLDTTDCPTKPDIDSSRSRWLASDDRGAIYMVSGDGKTSAVWKFYPLTKGWQLLKQTRNTRYQYLDVVHTMTDPTTVTLLTCDGVRGSLLLMTISRNSPNKILGEEDVAQTYGLGRFIHSPASAVVDHLGNMLILDYATGKVWLLRASNSGPRNGEGDRRLKLLTEVGPQQGIGLSLTAPWNGSSPNEHWCYLACFNKKRVHAFKYLSD